MKMGLRRDVKREFDLGDRVMVIQSPPLAVKVKGGGFFLVKHTVFGGLRSRGIVTMLSPPYHSPMLSNK